MRRRRPGFSGVVAVLSSRASWRDIFEYKLENEAVCEFDPLSLSLSLRLCL